MKKITIYPIMIMLLVTMAFAQGVTHDPGEITHGTFGGGPTDQYTFNSNIEARNGLFVSPKSTLNYAIYGVGTGLGVGYVGYNQRGIYGIGRLSGASGAGVYGRNAYASGIGVYSHATGDRGTALSAYIPSGVEESIGVMVHNFADGTTGAGGNPAIGVDSFVYGNDAIAIYANADPGDDSLALATDGDVVIGAYDYFGPSNLEVSGDVDVGGSITADGKICDSGGANCIGAAGDDDWVVSGTDLYSDVAGSVGIGDTTPDAKLDVAGKIQADNDIVTSDGIRTGGTADVTDGAIAATNWIGAGCEGNCESSGGYVIHYADGHTIGTDYAAYAGGIRGGSTGSPGGWAGYFNGQVYVSEFLRADGGIHVGGSANPGIDDLIVDGDVSIGTSNEDERLNIWGSHPYIKISDTTEGKAGIKIVDSNDPSNQYAAMIFNSGDGLDADYGDAVGCVGAAQAPYTNTLSFYLGAYGTTASYSDDEIVMSMHHDCPSNSAVPQYSTLVRGDMAVEGYYGFGGDVFGTTWYMCYNAIGGGNYVIARCVGSSARYKENIQDIGLGLDDFMRLRPVSFNYLKKYTNDTSKKLGLIAEEVEDIDPMLAVYENGTTSNVNDRAVLSLNIKATQDQQHEIEKLQSDVTELKKIVCLDHPTAEVCN